METVTFRSGEIRKDQLEKLIGKPEGSLELMAKEITHEEMAEILAFLRDHGRAVGALDLELEFKGPVFYHDATAFDFDACCPALTAVRLKRLEVNTSLLTHPRVETLQLDQCHIKGPGKVQIGVQSPSKLQALYLSDCNWQDDEENQPQAVFGPGCALREFSYSLDEDYAENCPYRITFDGCPGLMTVYADLCHSYELQFKGVLPAVESVEASHGQYGSHTLRFGGVQPGSSEYIRSMEDCDA